MSSALLLGALSGDAGAHAFAHPKRLAVRIDAHRVRVSVDYEVSPGPQAQAFRQTFDRDRSGALDANEQQALIEFLAASAEKDTAVLADAPQGVFARFFTTTLAPLPLVRTRVLGERTDDVPTSTALLAVHLERTSPLPEGNAPSGKRVIELRDRSSGADGHVPATVACVACEILEASQGLYAHDPRGDHVVGVELSQDHPLRLVLRFTQP